MLNWLQTYDDRKWNWTPLCISLPNMGRQTQTGTQAKKRKRSVQTLIISGTDHLLYIYAQKRDFGKRSPCYKKMFLSESQVWIYSQAIKICRSTHNHQGIASVRWFLEENSSGCFACITLWFGALQPAATKIGWCSNAQSAVTSGGKQIVAPLYFFFTVLCMEHHFNALQSVIWKRRGEKQCLTRSLILFENDPII